MTVPLNKVISEFPKKRQKKIRARAKEIENEMYIQPVEYRDIEWSPEGLRLWTEWCQQEFNKHKETK